MNGLLKKAVYIILILLLIFNSMYVFAGSDGSPDGFSSWDEFYASITGDGSVTESKYVPKLEEMKLIADKNKTQLYFYENENVFYLQKDKKIWSSILLPDAISNDGLSSAEWRGLFSVKVVGNDSEVQTFEFVSGASSDFEVTHNYTNKSVILNVLIPSVSIGFNAEIGLDENGLYCTISDNSIIEEDEYKLMSISILPCFMSAAVTEKGYITYADGSGALIEFSGRKSSNRTVDIYQIWGNEEANLDELLTQTENDMHSVQLPVVGMKHTSGGCVAAVTDGAEIATLNIVHGNYYSTYFSLDYRTFYNASYNFTGSVFDEKQITSLTERRAKGKDCTIRWFLLDGENNTYSDMAVRYREYLVEEGLLNQKVDSKDIPVSLDIFMNIEKSGLFGDKIISLTSSQQAIEMIKDLLDKGITTADIRLMGWSKGGYTAIPTLLSDDIKSGNVEKLIEFCNKNNFSIYKSAQYLKASTESSSYNGQKDVLRDCIQQIITDKNKDYELISPRRLLNNRVVEWKEKMGTGICLEDLGINLLSGFDENGEINRTTALSEYKKALATLVKDKVDVSVSGGNSYVLPFVNRLYDIPDTDSGYYRNTKAIPFYQMIVHGYIDYSSLAGNRSFDLDYQKLKWIETGSIPHYFVTHKSSVEFQDTDYNTVFSSRYEDYSDIILQTYKEFNEKLGEFWNEPINSHQYLSDDVVKVIYGSQKEVLINYSNENVYIEGQEIPAKSYVIKGVKN